MQEHLACRPAGPSSISRYAESLCQSMLLGYDGLITCQEIDRTAPLSLWGSKQNIVYRAFLLQPWEPRRAIGTASAPTFSRHGKVSWHIPTLSPFLHGIMNYWRHSGVSLSYSGKVPMVDFCIAGCRRKTQEQSGHFPWSVGHATQGSEMSLGKTVDQIPSTENTDCDLSGDASGGRHSTSP